MFSVKNEACVDEIPFWVDFSAANSIPAGALKAGHFRGEPLYIGRALHEDALTPGCIKLDKFKKFLKL